MSRLFEFDDDDDLVVVKNFFSEFTGNLPDCISRVLNGVGYGNEYAMCTFPDDIEPDEVPFTGVRFTMFENDVKVIDEQTFRAVVVEACRRYLRTNPSKRGEIMDILSKHGLAI
jgi:hypothetical protein